MTDLGVWLPAPPSIIDDVLRIDIMNKIYPFELQKYINNIIILVILNKLFQL